MALVKHFGPRLLLLLAAALTVAAGATSAPPYASGHPRLLLGTEEVAAARDTWARSALFGAAIRRAQARVAPYLHAPPPVPIPKDAGGGYTHERHKANGILVSEAAALYQWTGEAAYAGLARRLLLAYAEVYSALDLHPARKDQAPGRLFWQSLNESVWLVYAIQGYDAVFEFINAEDRQTIETRLLRPMARFLSVESPETFDRIHNHGTWATAAVGMTGYVLDDPHYVRMALLGTREDGEAGFLAQLRRLFSPDGYYMEGPYYQRYALMPFVVFAKAIERNDPRREIFSYRDGILAKAIRTTIQLTYGGLFFPVNDAIRDKGLDTVELDHAIAIAYGGTGDATLLSLVDERSHLVLTADALRLAMAKGGRYGAPVSVRLSALPRRPARQSRRTHHPPRRHWAPAQRIGVQSHVPRHGARALRPPALDVLRQWRGGGRRLRRGAIPQRGAEGGWPLPSGEHVLGEADGRPQHAGDGRGEPVSRR